jgi:cyclopropane fatty-acyl-phospholipid synthase-like methyltransferase
MAARLFVATWRDSGSVACARKLGAAVGMGVPMIVRGRRTARSVGAYFDLITDDGRMFYGDSFHLGYFAPGVKTLAEALEAHTDLVGRLAKIASAKRVLDVGCGLGAPALRMARRYGCSVTGVNISREQVRQGRALIAAEGLSHRVAIERGDARALDFADASFDSVMCLEAAGDICVSESDKERLVSEWFRVLRPGGHVGFSDLAFSGYPTRREDRTLRSVLYHTGAELVSDWPAIFRRQGFRVLECRDILQETLPTWKHAGAVYASRAAEVKRRYGKRLAARTATQLERIHEILSAYGTVPSLCAQKPA